MKRASATLALVTALGAAGCHGHGLAFFSAPAVRGSGRIVEEDRSVGAFSGVEVGSAIEATVAIGATPAVRLKGDDNLVKLVRTEVRDGRLVAVMDVNGSIESTEPIRLTVVVPRLDRLGASGAARLSAIAARSDRFAVEASGASKVAVEGIDTPALEVDASGAATIRLVGRGGEVKLDASGASTLDASKLDAESAVADANGASTLRVRATRSVRGEASGASSLHLIGKPPEGDVSKSGAASIHYHKAE